jgi:hypothetical protein
MLEATPGKPWGIGFKDLLDVEPNMKLRCRCPTIELQKSKVADEDAIGGE